MSYTKLDSSIIASTVWMGSLELKAVWITMLAMKNERHIFEGSVPGLAKLAGVSLEQCEVALHTLLSPDQHSRSKEFEGRRIEAVDGGWVILNGPKYREKNRSIGRTDYMREAKRRQREKERESTTVNPSQPDQPISTDQIRSDQSKEKDPPTPQGDSPSRPKRKKREPLPEQFPERVVLPCNLSEVPVFIEAWSALLAERKRSGILTTEFAAKLQLRKLSEWAFRRGMAVAIEACELATAGGNGRPWQGIFEPEERKGSPARASGKNAPPAGPNLDVARRALTEKVFAACDEKRIGGNIRDQLLREIQAAVTLAELQEIRWP